MQLQVRWKYDSGAGMDLEGRGKVVVYFDVKCRNLSEKADLNQKKC
jgi:hypothetical protein